MRYSAARAAEKKVQRKKEFEVARQRGDTHRQRAALKGKTPISGASSESPKEVEATVKYCQALDTVGHTKMHLVKVTVKGKTFDALLRDSALRFLREDRPIKITSYGKNVISKIHLD